MSLYYSVLGFWALFTSMNVNAFCPYLATPNCLMVKDSLYIFPKLGYLSNSTFFREKGWNNKLRMWLSCMHVCLFGKSLTIFVECYGISTVTTTTTTTEGSFQIELKYVCKEIRYSMLWCVYYWNLIRVSCLIQ